MLSPSSGAIFVLAHSLCVCVCVYCQCCVFVCVCVRQDVWGQQGVVGCGRDMHQVTNKMTNSWLTCVCASLALSRSYSLSPSLSLCSPPSPLLVRVRRINSCMAKYANKVAELLATSTTARSRPHTRRCGGGAKAVIGRGVRG